jgi:hypothetical protein
VLIGYLGRRMRSGPHHPNPTGAPILCCLPDWCFNLCRRSYGNQIPDSIVDGRDRRACGVFTVCRQLGWEFVILLFMGFIMAAATARSLLGKQGVSWWCFISGVTSANVISLLIIIFYQTFYGYIILFFSLILLVPTSIGSGVAWAAIRTAPTTINTRTAVFAWVLVFALGLMPLSMPYKNWPLRAAFFVSMSAMNRLADRVAARQIIRAPVRAGLFTVVDTAEDLSTGNVALILDPDPAGRTAFVRIGSLAQTERRLGPLYNLIAEEYMYGRWWYQQED